MIVRSGLRPNLLLISINSEDINSNRPRGFKFHSAGQFIATLNSFHQERAFNIILHTAFTVLEKHCLVGVISSCYGRVEATHLHPVELCGKCHQK